MYTLAAWTKHHCMTHYQAVKFSNALSKVTQKLFTDWAIEPSSVSRGLKWVKQSVSLMRVRFLMSSAYARMFGSIAVFVATQGRVSKGLMRWDRDGRFHGLTNNLFTGLCIRTQMLPRRQTDNDGPMTRNKAPWSGTGRVLTSTQIRDKSGINTVEWQACHRGVTKCQLTMLIKTVNKST